VASLAANAAISSQHLALSPSSPTSSPSHGNSGPGRDLTRNAIYLSLTHIGKREKQFCKEKKSSLLICLFFLSFSFSTC
jgi:hypothetical protein